MARYVTSSTPPRDWGDEWYGVSPVRPTEYVVETDKSPSFTGLLDASGTRIYRTHDTVPMGFQAVPKPVAPPRDGV